MIYKVGQAPYKVIQIKTPPFYQGNPQNNEQILTLLIALHDRHNNFYAYVTPS